MNGTIDRVNGINGTTHETATPTTTKKSAKPAKKKTTSRRGPTKKTIAKARLDTFRVSITIALGIAIPALSLALSHIAGTLGRHDHAALAIFAGGCGIAVLAVSLSHLAEAVEHITGAQPWQSWLLAIALDLTLICCELVQVYATDTGLTLWCRILMCVVALFSMALNCYAFLGIHDKK